VYLEVIFMKKSFIYTVPLALLCISFSMLPIPSVQRLSRAYHFTTAPRVACSNNHIARIYRRYISYITPIDEYPLVKFGFSPHIIVHANEHFNAIPGFNKVKNVVDSADKRGMYGFLKGYLWELEFALALRKAGYRITAFHDKKKHAQGTQKAREIDVVAGDLCVECKNMEWLIKDKKIENKLKEQFVAQKAIVESYKNNRYLLASREPLPATWKKWLADQNINYIEGSTLQASHPVTHNPDVLKSCRFGSNSL
jgi:hypothetical protein